MGGVRRSGGCFISPFFILIKKTGGSKMALKLSSGLTQYLLGSHSLRKAFSDAVLNIYSGPAPTNAEDAPTGVLLCQITKASMAVAPGAASTPAGWSVLFADITSGHVYHISTIIDGITTTVSYTLPSGASLASIAAYFEVAFTAACPQLAVISAGSAYPGYLFIKSNIPGITLTVQDGSPGSTTPPTYAMLETASRANTIQLGLPEAGVIGKSADVWSGVILASGTAGYYRLVTSTDLGTAK